MSEPTRRPKIRCAIYTRKSTEEGLEQDFNSLDAQAEACAAYVASQKNEGWVLLPQTYDDGGLSGGTLERPGLQQLLADVDAGLIDQIIVYKVDRLTRSLTDFTKLVERLDASDVSFVSVTQSFNTSTSMGRLTLNMLLSFAQFEREVTTERIRDKIAASKAKGLWMGGSIPLGYTKDGRSLAIVEEEAETVRRIFEAYLKLADVRQLAAELEAEGLRTKPSLNGKRYCGKPYTRGMLYHLLRNPLYLGKVRHKDKVYEGQHEAIIDDSIWEAVQSQMNASTPGSGRRKAKSRSAVDDVLLRGKLWTGNGQVFQCHSSRTKGVLRFYYVQRDEKANKSRWRLPAKHLDQRVLDLLCQHLRPSGELALELIRHAASQADQIKSRTSRLATDKEATAKLLRQVTLHDNRVDLEIDATALLTWMWPDSDPVDVEPYLALALQGLLKPSFEFTIKKRGQESRLVIEGDHGPGTDPDPTLIANIGRAVTWYQDIKRGITMMDIAKRENLSQERVKQILHLAFLNPASKRSLLNGSQPAHWNSQLLMRTDLSLC